MTSSWEPWGKVNINCFTYQLALSVGYYWKASIEVLGHTRHCAQHLHSFIPQRILGCVFCSELNLFCELNAGKLPLWASILVERQADWNNHTNLKLPPWQVIKKGGLWRVWQKQCSPWPGCVLRLSHVFIPVPLPTTVWGPPLLASIPVL